VTTLERHVEKWVPEPNTGCFIWMGAVNNVGRPMVGVAGDKVALVSRLVCEEAYGLAPTLKHEAAHNTPNGCVGGICVNGAHLRWATRKENAADIPPELRAKGGFQSWVKSKNPRNICKERQEAKLAGSPTYFTGKPCKSGHVSPRHTVSGDCVVCRTEWNAQRAG
jgi:hypothetical protein